jgi:hypothetical protein
MMPAQVDRRITLDQLVILINQSQCVIQNGITQAFPIQECLEERSSARTLINRSLILPSTCMVFHMLEVWLKFPDWQSGEEMFKPKGYVSDIPATIQRLAVWYYCRQRAIDFRITNPSLLKLIQLTKMLIYTHAFPLSPSKEHRALYTTRCLR